MATAEAPNAPAPTPARKAPGRLPAVTLTDAAADRVRYLMSKSDKPALGVRIGISTKGCSGLSYTVEYVDAPGKFDEVIEDKGVTVMIDAKAVMFLIGSEMDFVQDKFQSGFVFNNPNEKGRCGCGESFHV